MRADTANEGVIATTLAALFGVALVVRLFPRAALDGTLTLAHPALGDMAQHIVGQRYFLADIWYWPPLITRLIEPPGGVSIALTDSIPLAALAMRPFAGLLPPGGHLVYAWVALCFLAQPVAGVLALRAAGVRGVVMPLAGGVIAVCMPALIFRYGHAALCAHFTLLLALALYFRTVADPRAWLMLPGAALMVASLLIHPYLMAMVVGIVAAAPVSLLLRRQGEAAARLGIGFLAALAVLLGIAAACGYLEADRAPGFGYYSLNLLEPFVPAKSTLAGDHKLPDATGGQFEGFSYLGLGLMLLALCAIAGLRHRAAWHWLGGHAGLLIVAAGAGIYALSDTVYAGQSLLFHMPIFPAALQQFRASGRFVWIDLYTLVVLATVLAAMTLGRRLGACVLVVASMLQFVDTSGSRAQLAADIGQPTAWAVDPAIYRPLMAKHRSLTLWPTAACQPELVTDSIFMQLLLLSSEIALPVNTIPTARTAGPTACDPAVLTRPILAPGELRLSLPGTSGNLVATVPGLREHCHRLPGGVVGCTPGSSLDDWPVVEPAFFVLGQTMSLGEPVGAALPALGWTQPSIDGAWTIGPRATLLGAVQPVPGALRLSMVAHGMGRGGAQTVRVRVNGQEAGLWRVANEPDATYRADLPPGIALGGTLTVTLDIADPVSPKEVTGSTDLRPLGFFLRNFRLDPLP